MYTISMTITNEEGEGNPIDSTVIFKVAARGLAFALMAEWSNFLKQSIKDMIEKGQIT